MEIIEEILTWAGGVSVVFIIFLLIMKLHTKIKRRAMRQRALVEAAFSARDACDQLENKHQELLVAVQCLRENFRGYKRDAAAMFTKKKSK